MQPNQALLLIQRLQGKKPDLDLSERNQLVPDLMRVPAFYDEGLIPDQQQHSPTLPKPVGHPLQPQHPSLFVLAYYQIQRP